MARSLRSFMIAFLLALVIIAIAAIYIVPFLNNLITEIFTGAPVDGNQGGTDIGMENEPNSGDKDGEKLTGNTFTVLFIVPDRGGEYADAIAMMKVDKENRRFIFSQIPTNLALNIGGVTEASGEPITLSSIYFTHGCEYLAEAVSSLTGIYVDYYVSMDQQTFVNIIDKLGGVTFHVPADMKYKFDPNATEYEINLKEGTKVLTGEEALMLVRFRGYTTGDEGRRTMQLNFLKYAMKEYLTPENLLKTGELYKELSVGVDTNLTLEAAVKNADLLFKFMDYKVMPTVIFPTLPIAGENNYVSYDHNTVLAAYAPYK